MNLKQCARCTRKIMPRDEHFTPFDWKLVFCSSICIEMWKAHAQPPPPNHPRSAGGADR